MFKEDLEESIKLYKEDSLAIDWYNIFAHLDKEELIKYIIDLQKEVAISNNIIEEKEIPEKLYGIVNPKEGTCKLPSNEQLMNKINEIIDILEMLNDKIK